MINAEMARDALSAFNRVKGRGGNGAVKMRAAIEAVAPAVRAAAMEEAAKIADDKASSSVPRALDNDDYWGPVYRKRIAAAIRSAKETA